MADRLLKGEKLNRGSALTSPNDRYSLVMQDDGNLVIYITGTPIPIWSSRTHGNPSVAWAAMQADGNFVIYKSDGTPIWDTNTHGANDVAWLAMQDDGNLVIYRSNGQPIWASNTIIPNEFFDEVQVEIPASVWQRAHDQPDTDGSVILLAITCTATPGGAVVCVGAMIVIAILLEISFGDPPFGPNNDIRVIGGHVSEQAKRAARDVSTYAKELGDKISQVFKRWF